MLSQAQNAVVSAVKMNVLYIGVDNPLELAINKADCKDFELSISNGNIRCNDSCKCIANVDQQTKIYIYVLDRKNKRIVDSILFRGRLLPAPQLDIGSCGCWTGCHYYKDSARLHYDDLKFDIIPEFKIESFYVNKYRNDSLIESIYNIGSKYSQKTKELIATSKYLDVIVWEDIFVVDSLGNRINVNSVARRIE